MAFPKTSALIALLAVALLSTHGLASYRRVPFIIHVQSTRSDNGFLTLEQIAQTARDNGITGVIFNDHDIMKWEYGIRPLSNVVKRTVARTSVLSTGPESYLDELTLLGRKYPDLVLVPGVESAPFYYWSGSPFKGLTLNNWHKHLLIAGLYRADDYRRLPLVGNERGGTLDFRLLWPVVVILFGCLILNWNRKLGVTAALIGILFSINNYPFRRLPYDQYHGDQGDLPYQNVIDYVARVAPGSGLVFWAHPESPNFAAEQSVGSVSVLTPRYPESLLHTDGYTGFGYFQEGERTVGKPGGIWDRILTDHVNGKRNQPVWAVSELDYRKEGHNGTYMNSFKNILFVPTGETVDSNTLIKGIKDGRFYALRKQERSFELILDELSLTDGVRSATMGETLPSPRPLQLVATLHASDNGEHPLTMTVVSNGKTLHYVQSRTPACVRLPLPAGRAYYRVEFESSDNAKIVANPLFTE